MDRACRGPGGGFRRVDYGIIIVSGARSDRRALDPRWRSGIGFAAAAASVRSLRMPADDVGYDVIVASSMRPTAVTEVSFQLTEESDRES
jgi:hypothetical protein